MKTIAITIDEESLRRLKQLETIEEKNRSEIVREAVSLYLGERERREQEEREAEIFRKQRKKLHRQASALIRDQEK